VKLSWTLLDAGTRRRNAAEQASALYRAKAQTASLAKELKVAHDTLPSRVAGARHGLAARQAALRAAESAVEDSLAAYRSGAGQLIDVRSANEMRLTAELAVYQAEVELQGLALEWLQRRREKLIENIGSIDRKIATILSSVIDRLRLIISYLIDFRMLTLYTACWDE
jgi:chromosome segregation ATPase